MQEKRILGFFQDELLLNFAMIDISNLKAKKQDFLLALLAKKFYVLGN